MAKVKLSYCRLERIKYHYLNDIKYYNYYEIEEWEQIKAILNEFGIKFPSKYEVEFDNSEYQIETVPEPFGATEAKIVYKGAVVAKVSADGSNFCDREGELVVYMDKLKDIYTKPFI